MDGKPLSMNDAWRVYDRFFTDERVVFVPEPGQVEMRFRQFASGLTASPKLWADAWLLAVADAAKGFIVTFDRALATRCPASTTFPVGDNYFSRSTTTTPEAALGAAGGGGR